MLEVVAAEVELAQSGKRPPAGQEEQVVLGQSAVLEVDVDEPLAQRVEHDAETIAHVAVAQVQTTQLRQRLRAPPCTLIRSLGPFHGAIAVPSVTRCRCRRCRCCRGHRCAGGARQYR